MDLERLVTSVESWLEHAYASNDPAPLMAPERLAEIGRLRELDAGPAYRSRLAKCFYHLGAAFLDQHTATGDPRALAAAVEAARKALDLIGPGHARRGDALEVLAACLRSSYDLDGGTETLDEAIAVHRQARDEPPGRPGIQADLGRLLHVRHQLTGRPEPLDEAVDGCRRTVGLLPPGSPLLPGHRGVLGNLLLSRYWLDRKPGTLTEAIGLLCAGYDAIPPGAAGHEEPAANLAAALSAAYHDLGDVAALEQAIDVLTRALTGTPPDRPHHAEPLTNLAGNLYSHYLHGGDPATLDRAIDAGRRAVAVCPAGHPNRFIALAGLGITLQAEYERGGNTAVLDAAIEANTEALALVPADSAHRPAVLSNLGANLQSRYLSQGDLAVLDRAIDVTREAAGATAPGRPHRAMYLSNLARALLFRFEHTRELGTVNEAVEACRTAVAETPEEHPAYAGRLGKLADALRHRHVRTEDLAALTEAADAGRAAIDATEPGHADLPGRLSIRGEILRLLHARTGDPAALDAAVDTFALAVAAAPPDHADLAMYLTARCVTLRTRYELTGEATDLAGAVEAGRRAVAVVPRDHPYRARYLSALATTLKRRHDAETPGATWSPLLEEAIGLAGQAADAVTATTSTLLAARRELADLWMAADRPLEALAAYERAIALLPRLAPRHRDRADREHGLGDMSGLAADAAAAAIAAGRPHHAVELLEQARGILFGELMSERGDLLRLHDHAPELAGRFERLRAELDAGRPYTLDLARRQERLGQDWDDLLARIRAEPGFARFLLPPPIDELRRQAGPGPVVVLNSSRHRCDALVLTSDGDRPVRLVALPALSRDDIVSQAGRLHAAITDSRGDRRRWRPAQQAIADVLAWLWDAVVAPVLTGPEPVGAGRVWWCPVAELTALPLHAAGRPGSRESALDHVVSSYTPTIRALGYARDHAGAAARDGGPVTALIVAMPETPGATRLPKAGQEAGHVAAALPGSAVLTGPEATYAAVRDGLPLHPVAHLACHGVSDLADPASSRLLLHDHAERPLTVAALSRLRIAGARLAFLSACSTTAGGDRLPDEAMHITTAFQLAGFQQVIGTLWPVNDTIAARVAEGVYAGLGGGVEQAADALRDAIRGLRDAYPDQPALWAGYVHAGA